MKIFKVKSSEITSQAILVPKCSWEGHVAVWLRFRLRSGSAGLFENKKRRGMVEKDRCVLCNGGKVLSWLLQAQLFNYHGYV